MYAIALCIGTLDQSGVKYLSFLKYIKARTKFSMRSLLFLFQTHREISVMDREMTELYEAAGLFEVNVPEFKQLKACRREAGREL